MPFVLTLNDDKKHVNIQSDKFIASENSIVLALLAQLTAFHKLVPLVSFELHQQHPDTTLYSFEFVTVDGRTWHQDFSFGTGGLAMSFVAPALWKPDDFQPTRPIRESCFTLVRDFSAVHITANFT